MAWLRVASTKQAQVDFLCALLVCRVAAADQYDDWPDMQKYNGKPISLKFVNSPEKELPVQSIGGLARSMRLNWFLSDATTVASRRVLEAAPSFRFSNTYLLTCMSTVRFAEHLLQSLGCL